MRTFFTYLAMIAFIFVAYKVNIFALFASKWALPIVLMLVVIVFIVAFKVLGNPFIRKDSNDENND